MSVVDTTMRPVLPTFLSFETSFCVFPQDTNYHPPMVFGGKMLSEMDICAAGTVRRALYDSPLGVRDAVTVQVDDVTFHKGAVVKDLIFLQGTITKIGIKSITVEVKAYNEVNKNLRELMASGTFVFVAYDIAKKCSVPHGLTLLDGLY